MARKTYFKGRNIRLMQGGGHVAYLQNGPTIDVDDADDGEPGGKVAYSYPEKVKPSPDLIGLYPFTATAAPYPGGGVHPIMRDYTAEDLLDLPFEYMDNPYEDEDFRRVFSMLDLKDEDINWLNEKDLLYGANSLGDLSYQQKEWLDWIMNNRDRMYEPMGEYIRRFLRNYDSKEAQNWIYDVLNRASSTKYNPYYNTPERFK